MNDRQRKDRLIQTRVPQNLESTLKDEARRRRLSVSHLIRNVLEDTFNLVDNVVTEVDRVVTDSVEMAQTLKRDAQRLAATARGETSHREDPRAVPDVHARADEAEEEPDDELVEDVLGLGDATPPHALSTGVSTDGKQDSELAESGPLASGPLAHVYGFQELVLNRAAECANCECVIARGSRAYLGMNDTPGMPRVWVCQDCVETISGHDQHLG